MREVLFRGIDEGTKEWVYGYYYESPAQFHKGKEYYIFDDKTISKYSVIPETVGQYTGLTDKNGKKIFEGDIVKHYYYDGNPNEYDIGRVFWNGATCMYLRTCKSGDSCPQIWDSCEYEVIGNIHDNPELLKGGAE